MCHNCKEGHIARACTQTPLAPKQKDVNAVGEDPTSEDSDNQAIDFVVKSVGTGERDAPITVCMTLHGQPVTTEIDTSAAKRLRERSTSCVA